MLSSPHSHFTISGYGHISPSKVSGQLSCILYTIIGLPITMVFLANIGGAMANALKYTYSRLCCRWCRVKRKYSEFKGNGNEDSKPSLNSDLVGEEEYMPTETVIIVYLLIVKLMKR